MPSSSPAAMAAADRAAAALERLARLHPKLIDLGLDRSFALLEKLDNPHHHLPPTIHVAGTNGKGSTTPSVIVILRGLSWAKDEQGKTKVMIKNNFKYLIIYSQSNWIKHHLNRFPLGIFFFRQIKTTSSTNQNSSPRRIVRNLRSIGGTSEKIYHFYTIALWITSF